VPVLLCSLKFCTCLAQFQFVSFEMFSFNSFLLGLYSLPLGKRHRAGSARYTCQIHFLHSSSFLPSNNMLLS
jgi:hypothetical protein